MRRIALLTTTFFVSLSALAMSPQQKEQTYNQHLKNLNHLLQVQIFQRQKMFEDMALRASKKSASLNLFAKAYSEIVFTHPQKAVSLQLLSLQLLPANLHLSLISSQQKRRDLAMEIKVKNYWITANKTEKNQICSHILSTNKAIQSFYSNNIEIKNYCQSLYSAIHPPTTSQIRDLVLNTPDARNFKDGRFYKKPVLFQFCRTHRDYTCLQVMKDRDGSWVRNSSGQIWSQQKLSLSRVGNSYNQFNGDTPAGIYTLDGVMPEANKQQVYGRYRRLIMTFIPQSANENVMKSLLPSSSHSENWWKEALIARDMGRDLFRIHGTLRRNDDKSSTYYPFYPTLGCVASKESTYDGEDYIDQRFLLDQLMSQQGLQPISSNETRIRTRFYVIEINDAERPVNLQDLSTYGIQ